MSSWLQRFKQGALGVDPTKGNASFKGVAFFLEEHSSEFGRRIVDHEFPQQDLPFLEDLGRSMRSFSISGYVMGDDHLTQRDQLVQVVEKKGSGILVHPYFGKLTVQCKRIRPSNRIDENRITRFEMDFGEAGEIAIAKVTDDTKLSVIDSADRAFQALQRVYVKAYALAGTPYAATQQLFKAVQLGLTGIQDAKKVVGRISDFFTALDAAAQDVIGIASDAVVLFENLVFLTSFGVIDESQLGDVTPDNKHAFQDLQKLWSFAPPITISSPASVAYIQAMQVAGVVAAGAVSSKIAFDSVEDAFSYRDALVNQMNILFTGTTALDDDIFMALVDLRTQVQNDIDARSATLSRLTTFVNPIPLPAIVISNMLYGTVDQEADILARNGIAHPGFAGVAPLKVLLSV